MIGVYRKKGFELEKVWGFTQCEIFTIVFEEPSIICTFFIYYSWFLQLIFVSLGGLTNHFPSLEMTFYNITQSKIKDRLEKFTKSMMIVWDLIYRSF
jgi:hypothetical protein